MKNQCAITGPLSKCIKFILPLLLAIGGLSPTLAQESNAGTVLKSHADIATDLSRRTLSELRTLPDGLPSLKGFKTIPIIVTLRQNGRNVPSDWELTMLRDMIHSASRKGLTLVPSKESQSFPVLSLFTDAFLTDAPVASYTITAKVIEPGYVHRNGKAVAAMVASRIDVYGGLVDAQDLGDTTRRILEEIIGDYAKALR